MEQIKYTDLFDEGGINSGLNSLVRQIEGVKNSLLDMVKDVKQASEDMSKALSSTSSTTKDGRDDTRQKASEAEKLYSAYQELSKAIQFCTKNMEGLVKAQDKLNKAATASEAFSKTFGDALERIKAQTELAKLALEGMSEAQRKNTAEGQKLTQVVKTLESQTTKYANALKAETSAKKESEKATKSQAQSQQTLAQSYSSLDALIQQTGVNVESLLQSERQLDIAKKNGINANTSLQGSYNQLYAQYNLVKNVLNAMSAEMRNAEGVGKVWEAEAKRLMDTMKQMQEATGKHTLSVGDYSKALNGLNISTMQVLREMPTLANSLQQFFIAISNNVPIFVDAFQRVRKETGSLSLALKGVTTALFSWQTALLVVLTILPKIAKAIHDKRKAQEEDNKETKKQITYLGLLKEALLAVQKAETEDTIKLSTLVSITRDHSRSLQERITAASALKNIYGEQLKNYSAEEIALGKAKVALDQITESLKAQAQARALLNKITEAYIKQIDAEDEALSIGASKVHEYGYKNIKGLYDYIRSQARVMGKSVDEVEKLYKKNAAFVAKGDEDVWKRYDSYKASIKVIEETGKTIDDLTKRINVSGLLSLSPDPKNTEDDLNKIKDYYWEWQESMARIMADEEERDLRLNDIKYEQAKEGYQKVLDEQKKAGTLSAEQEEYLTQIILNLEEERKQKRWDIIWDYYNKIYGEIIKNYIENVEEVLEEEDLSISGKYGKILGTISKQVLNAREELNKSLVNGTYAEAKQEGAVLKELLKQKLIEEANYQKALLQMRKDTGELTADQYDIELAKIEEKLARSIDKLSGKKRKKIDLPTLIFGSKMSDEFGNVYKELSDEQKVFVQGFIDSLSTAMQYMDEFMDKRIEMAEIAVEAAQKETEAAKTALDYEMEARANGYANNVDLARKEYEEKLALEQKAVEEKKRLEAIQEGINTAQQIGSLITATAQLWASASAFGPIRGPILAGVATATMFGSFIAAKIQAAQAAKAKTYGEGGMEYINYGGSHASGNDVDFGRTKDGRPRRIERGEVVSVINKKNVDKYGVSNIQNVINSLNNGTFEKEYSKSSIASKMFSESSIANSIMNHSNVVESTERNSIADMYSLAFSMMGLPSDGGADLTAIEQGIGTLVEQNETKIVQTSYGRIEYRGNNKRIIRNS